MPFRVSLANRGTLPVTVLATELTGPTDFSFVQRPAGSATLDAGQEFTVSFQYKATSDIRAQAQVLFTVKTRLQMERPARRMSTFLLSPQARLISCCFVLQTTAMLFAWFPSSLSRFLLHKARYRSSRSLSANRGAVLIGPVRSDRFDGLPIAVTPIFAPNNRRGRAAAV